MSAIITVENLTKVYTLKQQRFKKGGRSLPFLSTISNLFQHGTLSNNDNDKFRALDDVSFTINEQEIVGIIGKNGSGKSTLLRIMCSMTVPTRGRVEVTKRYGALFALNAGFNMELSGRKNIYLICSIYKVPIPEIDIIIDDIIEFAEIGRFIDQPVKKYSSGMRSRLGFSILFKILPDLVFIDEALATGDESFRDKCFAQIRQLRDEGKTIVFVSHALNQVRELCDRVIWLHQGKLMADGDANETIKAYQQFTSSNNT